MKVRRNTSPVLNVALESSKASKSLNRILEQVTSVLLAKAFSAFNGTRKHITGLRKTFY
jgi:hypothetical protein